MERSGKSLAQNPGLAVGSVKDPSSGSRVKTELKWCLLIDCLEALGWITAAVVPDVLPICIPGVAQALRRVPFRFKR